MEKIKYYYNGKLVRTSFNKYTHGVLFTWDDGRSEVDACCGSMELAEKAMRARPSYKRQPQRWSVVELKTDHLKEG